MNQVLALPCRSLLLKPIVIPGVQIDFYLSLFNLYALINIHRKLYIFIKWLKIDLREIKVDAIFQLILGLNLQGSAAHSGGFFCSDLIYIRMCACVFFFFFLQYVQNMFVLCWIHTYIYWPRLPRVSWKPWLTLLIYWSSLGNCVSTWSCRHRAVLFKIQMVWVPHAQN